jgi:hypothetical protein
LIPLHDFRPTESSDLLFLSSFFPKTHDIFSDFENAHYYVNSADFGIKIVLADNIVRKGFLLNNEFQKYLKKVNLSADKMHPLQLQETKRAFFGACGQMLVLLRDDISILEESDAIQVLESLDKQVGDFWINEAISKN